MPSILRKDAGPDVCNVRGVAGVGFTSSSDNFKSHFVGKDDDGKATLKQSHYVEKYAVDSSKNSGVVCAICRERGVSKPWAENLSCDVHGCGKCESFFPKEHWSTHVLKDHKRKT